jgi:hypothetical protein
MERRHARPSIALPASRDIVTVFQEILIKKSGHGTCSPHSSRPRHLLFGRSRPNGGGCTIGGPSASVRIIVFLLVRRCLGLKNINGQHRVQGLRRRISSLHNNRGAVWRPGLGSKARVFGDAMLGSVPHGMDALSGHGRAHGGG